MEQATQPKLQLYNALNGTDSSGKEFLDLKIPLLLFVV